MTQSRRRIILMGAAGRDYHNFNVMYRNAPEVEVVAFTATQIPGIEGRIYPASLAGPEYPAGIPIEPAEKLETLCEDYGVDEVVFAYSDVPHEEVMHQASRALAMGARFTLPGPDETMIRAGKPVISVCAVRTGCGKSQTSRGLARHLRAKGLRVALIRHPMPYGDLAKQAVQRFATYEDLETADCTIEEREEYEPIIAEGGIVYAGVDYEAITEHAQEEADILIWDGGNNDFSFLRPDLQIVVTDALRPDQLTTHHPGEATLRMADIVVINKTDSAEPTDVAKMEKAIRRLVPGAPVVKAASPARLEETAALKGKRVVVVEDGPTITHGGVAYGAGYVAAKQAGAEIVDPRTFVTGELATLYERFPHIGPVLPAMGYGEAQIQSLEDALKAADAEAIIAGTPIDLGRLIASGSPVFRVRYSYEDAGEPKLSDLVDTFAGDVGIR